MRSQIRTLAMDQHGVADLLWREAGHQLGPWKRKGRRAVYETRCRQCNAWICLDRRHIAGGFAARWYPVGSCASLRKASGEG